MRRSDIFNAGMVTRRSTRMMNAIVCNSLILFLSLFTSAQNTTKRWMLHHDLVSSVSTSNRHPYVLVTLTCLQTRHVCWCSNNNTNNNTTTNNDVGPRRRLALRHHTHTNHYRCNRRHLQRLQSSLRRRCYSEPSVHHRQEQGTQIWGHVECLAQ